MAHRGATSTSRSGAEITASSDPSPRWQHAKTGLATYDLARFSALVPTYPKVELFPDGFGLLEQPPLPEVTTVRAPSSDADVLIRFIDGVAHTDGPVSPDVRARRFRRDTIVLLPAGLATDWHIAAGMPRVVHLHVPGRLSDRLGIGERRRTLQPLWNLQDRELDQLFRRLLDMLASPRPFMRLAVQGLALAAAARAFELGSGGSVRRIPTRAMTPGRLRRVRDFVEANLDGEIDLAQMAGSIGLSPGHFSRAFKLETGLSPYAWVLQLRVERVKSQLLTTRMTLAEIATSCGFATQSHMTESFRRVTGLPPRRWHRHHAHPAEET